MFSYSIGCDRSLRSSFFHWHEGAEFTGKTLFFHLVTVAILAYFITSDTSKKSPFFENTKNVGEFASFFERFFSIGLVFPLNWHSFPLVFPLEEFLEVPHIVSHRVKEDSQRTKKHTKDDRKG